MAAFDPQDICRCCLSDRRETLRSIFDTSIRDMYVECTSLQITPTDGLPGSICGMCTFKIISWSSFKQLCERSELMLKIQFNIASDTLPSLRHDDETSESINEGSMLNAQNSARLSLDSVGCSVIPVAESGRIAKSTDNICQQLIVVNANTDESTHNHSMEETILLSEQSELDDTLLDGVNNMVVEENYEDVLTIVDEFDEYMDEFDDDKIEIGENHEPERSSQEVIAQPKKCAVKTLKSHLTCVQCKLTFRSADRLEAHIRKHHDGEKNEVCSICGKGFENRRALYRHRLQHAVETAFPCPKCDKSYKYKTSLTLHLKIHQNGKCFVCDHCGKSFDRAHGLQSHMLSHSTDTPFECDQCEKLFKNEAMLRMHQLRHQGVKKFTCELCGKSFATSVELTTHVRMHTGQKPYKCSECEKAYKTKGHLAVHFRMHTGARPYSCDLCDQTFAHLKVLKQHRMVHTGERPHTCTVCERPFRQRSTLNVHMQTHRSQREADNSKKETNSKSN